MNSRMEAKKKSIYEYNEEKQRRYDKEEGREEGEARFAALSKILLELEKGNELLRATMDTEYRKELYNKYINE